MHISGWSAWWTISKDLYDKMSLLLSWQRSLVGRTLWIASLWCHTFYRKFVRYITVRLWYHTSYKKWWDLLHWKFSYSNLISLEWFWEELMKLVQWKCSHKCVRVFIVVFIYITLGFSSYGELPKDVGLIKDYPYLCLHFCHCFLLIERKLPKPKILLR